MVRVGDGLRNPIIIYAAEDGAESLIDGRNRLDALELAGFEIVKNGKFDFANVPHQRVTGVDPYNLAISMNLYRRHLDLAAKRKLIAKLLKLRPEASDRQIAFIVAVSHNTVKVVRRELETRGQIDHVKTRTDTKGRRQPAAKPTVTKGEDVLSAVESAEQHKRIYAADEEAHDHAEPAGSAHGADQHHIEHEVVGADQHHDVDRADPAPPEPKTTPRMQGTEALAGGKAVPEVGRKLTGAEVAAAFNELSKKECAEFFAGISPAKQSLLRQHFQNADAEIAKLMRESLALLTHPQHNADDVRRRLTRVLRIIESDNKAPAMKAVANSDADLGRRLH